MKKIILTFVLLFVSTASFANPIDACIERKTEEHYAQTDERHEMWQERAWQQECSNATGDLDVLYQVTVDENNRKHLIIQNMGDSFRITNIVFDSGQCKMDPSHLQQIQSMSFEFNEGVQFNYDYCGNVKYFTINTTIGDVVITL